MKKLIILLFMVSSLAIQAQQIPLPGIMRTADYLWNPALVGSSGLWGVHAGHTQQWIGFDGAPATTLAGGHRNLTDYNMAFGGDLIYDATGPLTFVGVAGAYRYQINTRWINMDDQVSFGLSANVGQRRFDATRAKLSDGQDPYLSSESASSLDFNAGAGVLYRSVADDRLHKSHFFVGAGASRLIPNRLNLDENTPFGNRIHANAVVGWRTAGYYMLDHTFWMNFAENNLYNLAYQFRFENPDVFWAGLNLNTNFNFGLESGVILDGSWMNAQQFRIGALANYHIKPRGVSQGFSMGIVFEVVREF